MFIITLFVFGPLLAARVRESRKRYDFRSGLDHVRSVSGSVLVYGVLNTVTIFR
jgi:hypothetical protein